MSEKLSEKRAKGGIARAQSLTPEKRKEIAMKAAQARWDDSLPTATHKGTLKIGDIEIPCAVLEDGRRIITQTGIATALGSKSGASRRRAKALEEVGAPLPVFLAPNNIKQFISNDLIEGPLRIIVYKDGNRRSQGYVAEIIPIVCEIWLKARDARVLQSQQLDKVQRAEILMRGLAHIGIVALVDEATGYQEVRDRLALQAILDKFLKREFAAWAKRFPDEFYKEIFRLCGLEMHGSKRPKLIAGHTRNIVYERLSPGIVDELERLNPKDERGHRKTKHHQWFTEDIGHPALAQHIHAITGLMRASSSWKEFIKLLDKAFPKRGNTIDIA